MKLLRKVGATSEIWQIFIQDSSSTTGLGLTGLTNASGGLTAYYHRDTDTTATAISLVSMTVGTFTSSGFKEIDATNMPGWYQFCPPNAAIASGAKSCSFHLKGAANMVPLPIEVDLDGQVDVTFWNGTVVASPATAGIPDVNAKNINNVATTSVATINANLGQTQPVNFTGAGASALVKSDMVDVAGAAVSTTVAQIGVNTVNLGGTAQTGRDIGASVLLSNGTGTGQLKLASGYVAMTWADIAAPTTTVNLSGTTIAITQRVDVNTIKTNPVVNGGTITFPTNATLASALTPGAGITSAGYLGDFNVALAETGDIDLEFMFHVADASGTPATLGGSPVLSIYKGSDLVEDATGITLVVDFDGRTGLCSVAIDTTVAALGSGNYNVVITTGTVGSVDVSGTVVASFSKNDRFPTTNPALWGDGLAAISSASLPVGVDAGTNGGLPLLDAALSVLASAVTGDVGGKVLGGGGSSFVAVGVQADIPNAPGWSYVATLSVGKTINGFEFVMTDSTNHAPVSGKTVTGTISKAGAAFVPLTNSPSGVSNGVYKIDLSGSTDLTDPCVILRFTATGCDDTFVTMVLDQIND